MVYKPQYGKKYQKRRTELLDNEQWCRYCGAPATVADHVPPVALHEHVGDDAGCCVLVSSCQPCSNKQGQEVATLRRQIGASAGERARLEAALAPDAQGYAADDHIWAVPWLEPLRVVPEGHRWPRYMSAPHPDAVGSLGAAVEDSAAAHGVMLRWWQRLALRRILEVDAAGELVWSEVIISTPRRCGKSWLLRELAWWRLVHAARVFGEPQQILHTSRTLAVTLDVARPAWHRARDIDGMRVNQGAGREAVYSGPSVWQLRSETGAYGHGAGLAICDEAWDYSPDVVAEGIQPTMMERSSPQLLLVSTAHRKATKLMPERRASALRELAEPRRRLLLEWSAPVGDDLLASAEAASPIWDRQRARHVRDAVDDARNAIPLPGEVDPVDSFVSQYVNDWAAGRQLGRVAGDPLVDPEDWEDAYLEADWPLAVAAVEDYFGRCYAVGWARCNPDSRDVIVGARIVADRDNLRTFLVELDAEDLLVGASVIGDHVFDGLNASPVGMRETKPALAAVRRGVAEGHVHHDGSVDLAGQMADVRVIGREGGLAVVAGVRSDVVRAAAWCVGRVEANRVVSPAVF